MGRNISSIIVGLAVVFLGVALWRQQLSSDSLNDQSALTAEFMSPAAGPTLVGHDVCGQCHQDNFRLHRQSGHALTFTKTQDSAIADRFAGKVLDAGVPLGLLTYEVGESGLRVKRNDDPAAASFPLDYALGSGHNAVTFLSLAPDPDQGVADQATTVGIEHRVSWFASDANFGLTPGQFGETSEFQRDHFGSVVRGQALSQCIDCHTTSGTIQDHQIVDLVASVNCEKCHGPGSEHVRQARQSEKPPPFSVGKSGWNAESELQLCGSCHRMPIDISPKQLREYPSMLARFQPVGMLRSECFLQSDGELKCSTCHNPHESSVAKSKQDYIKDCVKCHQEGQSDHVICSVSQSDGCIDCHMPPLRFEQGMIFHDHWIRVRAD